MKPILIESLNFDRKQMNVEVSTSREIVKIPIRRASKGQHEDFRIIFNGIGYEIQTKLYEKFKNEQFTDVELIKLFHETTHLDLRVISPAFGIGRYFLKCINRDDNLTMLVKKAGIQHLLKLDNVLEDALSIELLSHLNFDKKDVEKAIPINEDVKKISELIGNHSVNPFEKISENFENWIDRLHQTFWLYDFVEFSILFAICKRRETLIRRILERLKLDNPINRGKYLEILGNVKKFMVFELMTSVDPIDERRLLLELMRIESNNLFIYLQPPNDFPTVDSALFSLQYDNLADLFKSVYKERKLNIK